MHTAKDGESRVEFCQIEIVLAVLNNWSVCRINQRIANVISY